MSLFITLKDARGRRFESGGDHVQVRVAPSGSAASPKDVMFADVTDRGDGSYAATYTVPSKGNYNLTVEVNGLPVAGSPIPLFFAPPDPDAGAVQPATSAAGAAAVPVRAPGVAQLTGAAAAAVSAAVSAATAGLPAPPALVVPDPAGDVMARTVYISSVSEQITLDQLRTFFAFCGTLRDFKRLPNAPDLVIAEYATAQEAVEALALRGTLLGNRPVVVQTPMQLQSSGGASAAMTTGPVSAPLNPYLHHQLQQMQQMQLAMLQTQQMKAQVGSRGAWKKNYSQLLWKTLN